MKNGLVEELASHEREPPLLVTRPLRACAQKGTRLFCQPRDCHAGCFAAPCRKARTQTMKIWQRKRWYARMREKRRCCLMRYAPRFTRMPEYEPRLPYDTSLLFDLRHARAFTETWLEQVVDTLLRCVTPPCRPSAATLLRHA